MKRSEAVKLRQIVEQAAAKLDDQAASEGARLFPRLKADGTLVQAGARINWQGAIKRAAVDLWDTDENNPENAPALWEDIAYRDGLRMIPESISAGAAFAQDEIGWWQGERYKSLISANVYTPEQYPAGWEKME